MKLYMIIQNFFMLGKFVVSVISDEAYSFQQLPNYITFL